MNIAQITSIIIIVCCVCVCIDSDISLAYAEESSKQVVTTLSLTEALKLAVATHPDIALARMAKRFSQSDSHVQQAQLEDSWQASAVLNSDRTSPSSSFSANETTAWQLAGGWQRQFDDGDQLQFSASYAYSLQHFPTSSFASQLSAINPAYRGQTDIKYRHPLRKGAGLPAYHQSLAAINADVSAAAWQPILAARAIAIRVLQRYFLIASDAVRLQLANEGVARGKRLLRDQRQREMFGLIEKADRLQGEALLARRNMDKQRAISARNRDIRALNRLLLRDPSMPLNIKALQAIKTSNKTPSVNQALQQAIIHRPELPILAARSQAAQARVQVIEDDLRMQMDLVISVGTRSFDGASFPALMQTTTLNDRVVSIGLELSDTPKKAAANAKIRRAVLNIEKIKLEKNQLLERWRDELNDIISILITERETLLAAQVLVKAEQRQFNAEMKRYRRGASSTAALIQFEGSLDSARTDAEISRISIALAEQRLLLATGQLISPAWLSTNPDEKN
ncbi:MAG: TolC family protein [Mariprofundales bacterium]